MRVEPPREADDAAREVVDAALRVHSILGPGLLEGHYHEALADELRRRGRRVLNEVPARVWYASRPLRRRYRLDMLVDDVLVVEVKAVRRLQPIHFAQTKSYLAATGYQLALLLNFGGARMKGEIRRVVLSHRRV